MVGSCWWRSRLDRARIVYEKLSVFMIFTFSENYDLKYREIGMEREKGVELHDIRGLVAVEWP